MESHIWTELAILIVAAWIVDISHSLARPRTRVIIIAIIKQVRRHKRKHRARHKAANDSTPTPAKEAA